MQNTSDHDLLVRLDEKVTGFVKGVTDLDVRVRSLEVSREQNLGGTKTQEKQYTKVIQLLAVIAAYGGALATIYVALHK